MSEINRFMQARSWMKSNENFLVTWHAHVGYKLDLFECFSTYISVEEAAKQYNLSFPLLQRWVEVGLEVGHMKKGMTGKIKAKKKMIKYASASSSESVGILLREMMELHIPALLEYPELMADNKRISYLEDKFDNVVAETSELLEKAAVSPVLKYVKKQKPGSVIDLGCGYGGYLKEIHEHYPEISLQGVEISERVAKRTNENLGKDVPVYEGDLLDFIDQYKGQADMVMAHNIIYYFPVEEREEFYKKISSIVRKGGTVTFITPLMNEKHGRQFTAAFNTFMTAHDNLYPLPTLDEMKKMSKPAGLKIKDIKPLIREGGWYLVAMSKVT